MTHPHAEIAMQTNNAEEAASALASMPFSELSWQVENLTKQIDELQAQREKYVAELDQRLKKMKSPKKKKGN